MPKYILVYHGKPDITSPEQGAAHMEKWKAWSHGLGDAVIDPGLPAGKSITVTPDGVIDNGGSNPISGITVIQAASFEDATEMVKGCPHLSGTGTIEIAEAMDMDM
ncbi:hypothetical protein [Planktotalea sp.]|uniref:hypothetical protein n=1 Tax=Planktotalea sp. TaxID=2029877 RepID=UPI0032983A16